MPERLTFNHGAAALVRNLSDRPRPDEEVAFRPLPSIDVTPVRAPEVRADLAYWAVFAFTALLFFRPQDSLPVLAPLHLSEALAIGGLASLLVGRLMRGQPLMRFTPDVLGVWALAAVMVLTAPFSIWPGGAFSTLIDVYVKVALVFVLLTHTLNSPRLLRRFTWLIVLTMGYVAFRGVFDYARGVNLLVGGRLHGPVAGMMGNPNDLAMNMVTFLPLAGFLALSRGRIGPRALAAAIVLAMVATVLFTKSRAGMLGLVVMSIVFILHARAVRPGVGVLALVGVLATVPLLPSTFWTRVSSIVNEQEDETGSRQARRELMLDAWQTFLERPLTGVGAGQFKNYNPTDRLEPWRETHNVILQVLVELGIFGGLAFAFLLVRAAMAIVWTLRRFPPLRRRGRMSELSKVATYADHAFDSQEREWMRMHISAMSAGFAGWFVCAQFSSIGYYWTFYYLFALIIAARDITAQRIEAAYSAPRVERAA